MLSSCYTSVTGPVECVNDLKKRLNMIEILAVKNLVVAALPAQLEFMPLQSSVRDRTSWVNKCMDFPIKAKTVM